MATELEAIIQEFTDAEANLKAQVEKLFFGKIESTDFADEYTQLQDALARLKAYTPPVPVAPVAVVPNA